ncbi:hypothetical protein [Thermus thermophilus]|uniref:hypothetical protein n=1 Tax=Thermus thermophilus TaxID=274 RepID=UPI001CC4DEC3|nr:hypothetical protein [Thermus thermophilus]BDB11223.1 hypothetical protein TthTMY_09620 [Thermus thermophilus]
MTGGKRVPWLKALALGLGLSALAQQVSYPPSFGPYEALRQQVHAQCQGYLQQGNLTQAGRAYALCLQQVAASLSVCPPGMDFFSFQACVAAASAGYPAPGKAVLTRPAYRVEVRGGVERERDPRTGQVLREKPVSPRLLFTLERTPQGVYRGVTYDERGAPETTYWVSPSCELLDPQGRPAMDGFSCPVFPGKPYLSWILPPPTPGLVPSSILYLAGRYFDDFDGDGQPEDGYAYTGGTGGKEFTSGNVHLIAYDVGTGLLKYEYRMAVRESQATYASYAMEKLLLFQVR